MKTGRRSQGKIVIVTNYYPPHMVGGAEVVAHRQALMLRDRGWDVTIFSGRAAADWADVGRLDVDERDGLAVYRLSHAWMDTGKNFRNKFANQAFESVISTISPDLIHFHNLIGLGTELTLVAAQYQIKSVLTLHDYWGICYRGILVRKDWSVCTNAEMCGYCCDATVSTDNGSDVPIRLRRDYVAWCLSLADRIISPSRSLASDYARLGFTKEIVPFTNGIDIRSVKRRTRSPSAKVRFVCASYLGEHKGIPELIDALRILAQKADLRGRWELRLAGGGHLEGLAIDASQEMTDHFQFLGKIDRGQMLEEIYQADVLVLASIWPENEPVSLLEAMASGAALVATDIGGNREIVGHDGSGILCEPRNPASLAEALEELIRAPATIEQMSLVNQERARDYDEERTGDFIERIYGAPVPTHKRHDRVVICGGDLPDGETRQLIDALSYASERIGVRLLWHTWIEDRAWEMVDGLWWWGADCGLENLMPALSRGLPVCVRRSAGAERIEKHVPITMYHDEASFIDWIRKLPSDLETRTDFDNPTIRQFTRLRPREDFYLPC